MTEPAKTAAIDKADTSSTTETKVNTNTKATTEAVKVKLIKACTFKGEPKGKGDSITCTPGQKTVLKSFGVID